MKVPRRAGCRPGRSSVTYFSICQWAGVRYLLVGGAIILSPSVVPGKRLPVGRLNINDSYLCERMNEEHDHAPSSRFPSCPNVSVRSVSVAGRRYDEASQPKFTALLLEALRLAG